MGIVWSSRELLKSQPHFHNKLLFTTVILQERFCFIFSYCWYFFFVVIRSVYYYFSPACCFLWMVLRQPKKREKKISKTFKCWSAWNGIDACWVGFVSMIKKKQVADTWLPQKKLTKKTAIPTCWNVFHSQNGDADGALFESYDITGISGTITQNLFRPFTKQKRSIYIYVYIDTSQCTPPILSAQNTMRNEKLATQPKQQQKEAKETKMTMAWMRLINIKGNEWKQATRMEQDLSEWEKHTYHRV